MWKIEINYSDGSQNTFTHHRKGGIPLSIANDYYNRHKETSKNIIYQEYPIKDHEPMLLIDKIHELEAKED